MEFYNDILLFALLVFMVWRIIYSIEKGRVMMDLRSLNKESIPDNYPLPLQFDIMDSIRDKK